MAELEIQGPFDGPVTFMRVPYSRNLSRSKAAILGVPYDMGTHPVRIGSRQGPAAIREQSYLVRPYEPPLFDFNPLTELGVVDCGNVRVTSSHVEEAFEGIEEAVGAIVDAGAIPVTMGGDGSVTLPQLRAVHKRHPGLVVLHIDAHTDTYPGSGATCTTRPPPSRGRRRKAWWTRRTRFTWGRAGRCTCPASSSTPAVRGTS